MPSRHALRSRLLDGEFLLPAIIAVITLIYLISALQLGPPMRDGNMTASFFPIATAVVVLIALAVAMFHALRPRAPATEEAPADSAKAASTEARNDAPTERRYLGLTPGAIGVIVLTAGYLLAFDRIGYVVATLVYVLLLTGLFSGSLRNQWLSKLVATLLITLAGYLLFEVVFQVRLPTFWSQ
ncbi:tripartite tricarboxylate transporter TctB family protein [Salinicola aestuarinus]|uniref:tripartite tricarboxylate transporter TctB family protein n=1 Tax=Salinicola aestuarinus TaxID=1949082 RepID=UPI000DA12F71|nr:tripartite tricarboxylate transporter TctB family protein [Salinicola aestuarinus]